jgi:hypothetical protein
MATRGLNWAGVLARMLGALLMVFLTWNPDGWSYWHWAVEPTLDGEPGARFGPLQALAGLALLSAWIVVLGATRRSLGFLGTLLVAALVGAVLWLLIDWHVVSARESTGIGRAALIVVGIVLGVGMSWSRLRGRLTGQVATDEV